MQGAIVASRMKVKDAKNDKAARLGQVVSIDRDDSRRDFRGRGPNLRQNRIISLTFGHAPFYVGRDKGFFRNEALVGEVTVRAFFQCYGAAT